ncbi:DUF4439 domain-containing protein, partial [Streptomyces prasinus]|uniref:DUF4439 domain-containing protein n=1 Tax=Streptomyces prasinus TaxID=67345 RepID=UPI0036371F6C
MPFPLAPRARTGPRRRSLLTVAPAALLAAVYGYGVVGGRIAGDRRAEARSAYDAHRARRDALVREVKDMGADPVAAAAGYALPFQVPDPGAGRRRAAGGVWREGAGVSE